MTTPKNPPTPSTTRQKNRVARLTQAIEARADHEQSLGFCVRDFVLCSLPYKRQAGNFYERKNGSLLFQVVAHPKYGLPFGQDRLIPIWLASAFQAMGKPEDNTIRFSCASDLLRAFGLEPGGSQLRELRGRIERVFGATFFSHDPAPKRALLAEGYRLIRRVALWFHDHKPQNQHTLWQNSITLSAEFADDLRETSLPVDLETIRAFKESPAALDLYAWQAWRSYRLLQSRYKRPVCIPVFGPDGLLAQLGSSLSSGLEKSRKARQLVRRWQALICESWKDCPNRLSQDGDYLFLRPGRAVALGTKLELPGVVRNPPPMRITDTRECLILIRDDEPTHDDEPTP